MFATGLTTVQDPRMLATGVDVIVLIAVIGFTVGRDNDAFLTCEDFTIAGSDPGELCSRMAASPL
jgi:hypothetical protein